MNQKPNVQRVGSYALIHREGQILLSRLSGGSGHGRWTLPGGGVEFGEHPEHAAAREAWEETGLRVRVGALRKITHSVEEGDAAIYHHIQLYYDADVVGGELTAEVGGSTDRAEWFSFEEARSLPQASIVGTALEILDWPRSE